MSTQIIVGDCRQTLKSLPAGIAQTCVTSPPYFGLRNYDGGAEEIGREASPESYISGLVDVFREVRRCLADDGTLWLNLGDCYGKGKQLLLMPYRVAMALQADGWLLRSAIVWHKPNPMPESVRDRPTQAYEHVFLLTKAPRYFYDAEAVAEPAETREYASWQERKASGEQSRRGHDAAMRPGNVAGLAPRNGMRNARNVWTIAPKPYNGAHFATMPVDLAERCIKAGSRPGDTVLDPFSGAGTTAIAATRLGRCAVLCELNPAYAKLADDRLSQAKPVAEPTPPLLVAMAAE